MADLTGQMLGRYRLESLLGRGGMAAVYRAFDEELRRAVAIKVILGEHVTDDSFLKRFKQEAELVAHLDHPNILPVYDFGEDAGRPYLVMPLRDGGSLESRMHGPVPPGAALSFIAQVAEALDAAHAAGILHRDVKPANVLLGRDDHIYLSDFGIAKMLETQKGLTATGMVIGTPTYMAPEQAAGKSTVPASDRYALAVMAFELLSGKPPYEGDSALAVLHQHVTAPVPPLSRSVPGLPLAVDGVLQKALAKEPADRHPSCREFARALASSVPGQLHAAAVTASPRTAPVAEEETEALSIPVLTPAPAAPRLETPRPPAVRSEASTATAPATVPSGKKMWPLVVAAAVAAGVVLVVVAGGRKAAEKEAAAPSAAPAPREAAPQATAVFPVPVLAPPPSAPLAPEATGGAGSLEKALSGPAPLEAAASVLTTWESFRPQVRYGHRPDLAEFRRALTIAQQARTTQPASPPAAALEHYARGGIAYLSGDLAAALAELRTLAVEAPPGGPFRQFQDIPEVGGTIPDWALALSYLDPRREARDLLARAEGRGDPGVEQGRRILARLEGEGPRVPAPDPRSDGGVAQVPSVPQGESLRELRDQLRGMKPRPPR
ncbi:MAG: serine/threonine protein kinase [Acidobacteria bacterium]|nr:serine/threonine protein kinase [Acidobacteriota bacterium]MCG3193805.1 Serine/threonine-protein kinase PknD [Thermoanaerobaculia bacterium]